MKKRLKTIRPKKLLGGAINAGATLAAAAMQVAATNAAAAKQAAAIEASAKSNADALTKQNENNTKLQEQSIDFMKSENELNRQIQRDLQMSLQLEGGQLDTEARQRASRINLKRGGTSKSKKGFRYFSLRGANMPFNITDGGGVLPMGITKEGYDVYNIIGDDHNHYHKTQGGKYKSGVGVRFANGDIVEAEGNENNNNGEILINTPEGGYFVSRHTMNGFNPADAVRQGIDPVTAYNIQENIKLMDNSNYSTPVERRRLKCGGSKVRTKYAAGGWVTPAINAFGNLGGAFITNIGNNSASSVLANAYNKAGNLLAKAYGSLQTIDTSKLNRGDFRAANYMPVVRDYNYNANPQLASIDRQINQQRLATNRNTLSSAAQLNRLGTINSLANDARDKIYATKYNEEGKVRQANLEALNEAAAKNAALQTEANSQFSKQYLDLLQYNNDIINERILGAADARSSAMTNAAGAIAQARLDNAKGWGSAIAKSGESFANYFDSEAKARRDYNKTIAGLSGLDRAYAESLGEYGNADIAKTYYDTYNNRLSDPTLSASDRAAYSAFIELLKQKYNL